MSLVAIIPARGGSVGVPRKNVRELAGKPLVAWTIEQALAAPAIDRVVVSTEDEEIAEVARRHGADVPFVRPSELATSTAMGGAVIMHALDNLPPYDDVMVLQPTSPLRSVDDIEGIVAARRAATAPGAVSVVEPGKSPYWMYRIDEAGRLQALFEGDIAARRQDLPPVFALNGALYLADCDWLRRYGSFTTPDTLAYVMPPERSADIDTPLDWDLVEFLMTRSTR
jgi:CMP-N,N'-diacetyllegionaminic acid synthase